VALSILDVKCAPYLFHGTKSRFLKKGEMTRNRRTIARIFNTAMEAVMQAVIEKKEGMQLCLNATPTYGDD